MFQLEKTKPRISRLHFLVALAIFAFVIQSIGMTGRTAIAQQPVPNKLLSGGHDLQNGFMPPGVIGQQRMLTRPEMRGYMQPIRFELPDGANIEIWDGSQYQALDAKKPVARLLVGAVYRLKVTNIPKREGSEIYPSIEVINRLFPPQGQADNFPVVVHISQNELEKAIIGKYVSRVTYLEDPETALPFEQTKGDQAYFQVGVNDDPLKVAASLGRPMTIVRMGSRVPLGDQSGAFELGNAPFEIVEPLGQDNLQSKSKTSDQNMVGSNQMSSPGIQSTSPTRITAPLKNTPQLQTQQRLTNSNGVTTSTTQRSDFGNSGIRNNPYSQTQNRK